MIYEYYCSNCSHKWEEQHGINDPRITICPACRQESARRLISGAPSFILKGDGWAKDLYAGRSNHK